MSDKKMLDDQINIAIAQKTAALVDKSDIRRSELARSLYYSCSDSDANAFRYNAFAIRKIFSDC